ncbi:PH domain-containing protein [Streptomyces sp. NPDC000594]|uniref:PH domain-containing protein n=1 Tax=Streptomyces sp. NPDC000594 TaxID=3154261 RepID=UPI0033220542
MTSSKSPEARTYADRAFRSPAGLVGGVLLLGLALWLGTDAILRGEGRTPWFAVAWLLVVVPSVLAFTLRPVVLAGDDRVRVRNPLRTIDIPWGAVDDFRAAYSSEVITEDGTKYPMWAIPVSLRQRKKANRQQMKAARTAGTGTDPVGEIKQAQVDQTIRELRLLCEHHAERKSAQGEPVVRWAFELIAPIAAGAVLLIALFATG